MQSSSDRTTIQLQTASAHAMPIIMYYNVVANSSVAYLVSSAMAGVRTWLMGRRNYFALSHNSPHHRVIANYSLCAGWPCCTVFNHSLKIRKVIIYTIYTYHSVTYDIRDRPYILIMYLCVIIIFIFHAYEARTYTAITTPRWYKMTDGTLRVFVVFDGL